MQSITGRAVDLDLPAAGQVDMENDVAEALARICRYGGHVPGGTYSVAQHCVVMSDALLFDTGDAALALYGLLHDAHEALYGDITTPQAQALAAIERDLFMDRTNPAYGSIVVAVIEEAKRRGERAIWGACRLPAPTAAQARIIKQYDLRMLASERLQLLAAAPKRWAAAVERAEPVRMRGRLTLWPTWKAAEEYRNRLRRLCPAFARETAR